MDMAVLLLCLHLLIAFYIYIIFMNSIKVNRDASLINIVIIIVILIFAFWNHNLNVFDTIFVKSKLLRWLMSLKSILIGLYVGTSHFQQSFIVVNWSNAIVMAMILFCRMSSSVRLWMMMNVFLNHILPHHYRLIDNYWMDRLIFNVRWIIRQGTASYLLLVL